MGSFRFPWAAGAYAHIEGPLSVFAPVIGATGINYLAALTAGLICLFVLSMKRRDIWTANLVAVAFLCSSGFGFSFERKDLERAGRNCQFPFDSRRDCAERKIFLRWGRNSLSQDIPKR